MIPSQFCDLKVIFIFQLLPIWFFLTQWKQNASAFQGFVFSALKILKGEQKDFF